MKDVFKFILFLAAVCLVACVCPPEGKSVYETSEDVVYYKYKGGPTSLMSVTPFKYKGHMYIMFGRGDYKAIVHDPDCSCHQHDLSEPIYNDEYNY